MSNTPIHTQESQHESGHLTNEGSLSMAPPVFQLQSGTDDPGVSRGSQTVVQRVEDPDTDTYNDGQFEIANPSAVIRNKDAAWTPIKYAKGDTDLPTKKEGDKEVPDESYIGKNKTIPNGSKVDIDDVFIKKATSKTGQDSITHVHCKGYGWTSVDNIKGGLKNESVGVMEATKPLSTDPSHYTVGVSNAEILKSGNRYPSREDNSSIPQNTEVTVEETFSGYYLDNKARNLAKVTYGDVTVYTSTGNYSTKAHDKANPNKRKITAGDAYIRDAVSSYIPDSGKGALALGKHVIIGTPQEKDTGTYVEVFEAAKDEAADTYTKGESLGWTNMLNLTHGFHTDLKGKNAMWNQVAPDERYDRAKGKDTEGTAKFTGNQDMIMMVDSQGNIEYVAKEIWPGLKGMLDAAQAAGQDLQLNTGFRDWDYQQAMVDDPRFAANPAGYSTHQRGIAVDLNNKGNTSTGGVNWWMERNAYKYGFVRTYQGFKEGHHWEYRPSQVTVPVEVEKEGTTYIKYTFATFSSESTDVWSRSYVLDPK